MIYSYVWESILENSKMLELLEIFNWIVCFLEVLELHEFNLFCIRTINLVYLLHLGNKSREWFSGVYRSKAT
jgi:hypothetical protein